MNREKLVGYEQLAVETGIPVRTLRSLVYRKVIPVVRLGHRTVVFSVTNVMRSLSRYEVRAVGDRK
jgi:hypothetical protein